MELSVFATDSQSDSVCMARGKLVLITSDNISNTHLLPTFFNNFTEFVRLLMQLPEDDPIRQFAKDYSFNFRYLFSEETGCFCKLVHEFCINAGELFDFIYTKDGSKRSTDTVVYFLENHKSLVSTVSSCSEVSNDSQDETSLSV